MPIAAGELGIAATFTDSRYIAKHCYGIYISYVNWSGIVLNPEIYTHVCNAHVQRNSQFIFHVRS